MAIVTRTSASLSFFGDDLDPDEVTRLLGGSPTTACRKGEIFQRSASGTAVVARTGRWAIDGKKGDGDQLSAQIEAILATLTNDLQVWSRLTQRFKPWLFCGVWMDEPNQGLAIEPRTSVLIGERGLALELDIYFDPDEPVEDQGLGGLTPSRNNTPPGKGRRR